MNRQGYGRAALLWLAGLALMLAAWWGDARDLAMLLWTRDTYSYGLWVPAVSAWLIWRDRTALMDIAPSRWLGGGIVLLGAALLWLLGSLVDAGLPRHLALLTGLQGLTLLAFGPVLYRRILFPMLFLYLMIPFGEALVPPLQHLTAAWSIRLLVLIGIPVTSDGVLITLPSGVYEVARACAGVQFLFTSLVVSVLMAHLAFQSWRRRLVMVLAGVLVPILANILRVFSILVLSELTGQAFAKGVDHIVYGWVFLSIILLILISLAYRFADRGAEPAPATPQGTVYRPAKMAVAVPVLLLPMLARVLLPPVDAAVVCPVPAMALPTCADCDYRLLEPQHVTGWPRYAGADREDRALYRDAGTRLMVYRALYSPERQGHRLSGPANRVTGGDWAVLPGSGSRLIALPGIRAREYVLWRGDARRLLWEIRVVDGHMVASAWAAKLRAGLSRLRDGRNRAAVLTIAADLQGDPEMVRAAFRKFLSTFPLDTILWSGVMSESRDTVCVASAG